VGWLTLVNPRSIQRGQVWKVTLDPTVGAEMAKTRPCAVVSRDSMGTLPIRVVVPITEWRQHFASQLWHVRLVPDRYNGLTKVSAADVLQIRAVSEDRFVSQLGVLSADAMNDITAALAIVLRIGV